MRPLWRAIEPFWPSYLSAHRHAANRTLHYGGTILGLALLAAGAARRDWRCALAAPAAAYGLAWIGHAVVERNRPATFRSPGKALMCDLRMLLLAAAGRLEPEFRRYGIRTKR